MNFFEPISQGPLAPAAAFFVLFIGSGIISLFALKATHDYSEEWGGFEWLVAWLLTFPALYLVVAVVGTVAR